MDNFVKTVVAFVQNSIKGNIFAVNAACCCKLKNGNLSLILTIPVQQAVCWWVDELSNKAEHGL